MNHRKLPMLKPKQTLFAPLFSIAASFYLGYGFSEVLLKSFVPDSWAVPTIALSAIGFFFGHSLAANRRRATPDDAKSPQDSRNQTCARFARFCVARNTRISLAGEARARHFTTRSSAHAIETSLVRAGQTIRGRHRQHDWSKGKLHC